MRMDLGLTGSNTGFSGVLRITYCVRRLATQYAIRNTVYLIATLLLISCATAEQSAATPTPPPTPHPGGLYVDLTRSEGMISPYVYGTNYGPWLTVPLDVQEAAQTSGITFLRFPGGEWGDRNDLQPYQIDQFIDLARQLGAEPSISVRLHGGTPEAAAELVRYTNVEQGYNVRYWSIGNEPSLYRDYDTETYNEEWPQFAAAMRAVDADILLMGPDTHQFTGNPATDPRDAQGRDWLRSFLEANGDLVDIVAVHRYPFPTDNISTTSIEQLRQNSAEWEQIIPRLRAIIEETTGRELPIAITEINSHWSNATGGEATTDSFYNAIWWADVLGRLISHDVDMVAHFALQSSPQMGGYGLLARYEVRPTYYVYQLYQEFGTERVWAESAVPHLSIYAARRDDGRLTLMVINLADEAQTVPLQLAGLNETTTAEIRRFDAAHQAEWLHPISLGRQQAITLPGQSITLYTLDDRP
jgi:hypothetical protein